MSFIEKMNRLRMTCNWEIIWILVVLVFLDFKLISVQATSNESEESLQRIPRIDGYFSCIGYLSANNLELGERRRKDSTYCWTQ